MITTLFLPSSSSLVRHASLFLYNSKCVLIRFALDFQVAAPKKDPERHCICNQSKDEGCANMQDKNEELQWHKERKEKKEISQSQWNSKLEKIKWKLLVG